MISSLFAKFKRNSAPVNDSQLSIFAELADIERLKCNSENLREFPGKDLNTIFKNQTIDLAWRDASVILDRFVIPDGTGGVNPGDRRALFYLISALRPESVLEIGTHIGASTINIALALKANPVKLKRLISVDIAEVNSQDSKPWLNFGAEYSPAEMINMIECNSFVDFKTTSSVDFAATNPPGFDLIFLDGDHSAKTVYQEIPLALRLLNRNGVILLHDYFPNMMPLWSNGSIIKGPFLATEKLRREGESLVVFPLGELPWPTKINSNVTSLAILSKSKESG